MSTDIRKAGVDDWEEAMELAWRTFLQFEAPYYPPEGKKNFLDFISGEALFKMFKIDEYVMYVAVDDGKIVGMCSMRGQGHISLLFVDKDHHRKGIGRKLLSAMQEESYIRNSSYILTVNAAPYAADFYKKLGFIISDDEKETDGIIYTPMLCAARIR